MSGTTSKIDLATRLRQRLHLGLLLSAIALAALAAVFMVWNIFRPYPLSARENSDLFVTSNLLKGLNPYALEQHPIYLYVYGIIYALVVYPFAEVFGATAMVSRTVSDVFIVLNCGVFFWGMRVSRVPQALAFCGALLLFSHLALNDCSPGPNSLGLFFMFLSIVVPFAMDFKWGSVMAGILLAILAFYTKPYFVIGAPLLISYLFLFRSKSKGIVTAISFVLLMIATAKAVTFLLPLYFTDIFYNNYNVARVFYSIRHLFHVGILYFPLGIGLVALLVWRLRNSPPDAKPLMIWPPQINYLDPGKPLFMKPSFEWVTYILIACLTVYVIKMGPHAGALLSYVYHLVTPFLIWRAFIVAGVEWPEKTEPLLFLQASVVLVAGFLVLPMIIIHQRDHTPDWRHAADLISSHRRVLGVGALAGILSAQGKEVYDAGQTEYYPYSFDHNPSPLMDAYKLRCQQYESDLEQKVRNREFDVIMCFSPNLPALPVSPLLISQYYHKVESFPLEMTFESHQMDVWEPNTNTKP
jgi:hypothetical protein